jgi:peptide/nickel transport system substrate-binding protein
MRRITFLIVLSLILSVFMVVATAQDDVAREDTLIFTFDRTLPDATNANPYSPSGQAGFRLGGGHNAIWEPLFMMNPGTGEISPWLGESFEPNESLDVWTLNIREGVKWSDGEDFNADDVIFTMEMLLNDTETTLVGSANMQRWIDSLERVDDLTVVFNLTAPNPRFKLDHFSVRINDSLIIMPEHIWAGQDPVTFTNFDPEQGWPVGTGAYTLTSLEVDRIVLDRDDNWWGAASGFTDMPEPLRLIWTTITTEDSRVQALASNQVDAGQSTSLAAFEVLSADNPNIIAWTDDFPFAYGDLCPRQLDFNTTVAPWDSANMRNAINLLIDREEIAEFAFDGITTPNATLFVNFDSMAVYNDAIIEAGLGLSPNADVEAGQALIEAEGYALNDDGFYEKDGEVLVANITVNNSNPGHTRSVDVIVEQLRDAGIDAVAVPVDNSTWWGDVGPNGLFDITWSWLSCGSINEPWASLDRYTAQYVRPVGERAPGWNNAARWNTENTAAYSEVVAELGSLPLGDPAAVDLTVEAVGYLIEDMPFIPLLQSPSLIPYNTTYWTGWPTAEDPYMNPAFWTGKAHIIIHSVTKAQ